MKKRILTSAIVCAVMVAVTLILFFVVCENPTSVQKTAFVFLLTAEILVPLGFIFIELLSSRSEKVLLNAGSISLLSIYFVITFILSLLFLFKALKSMNLLISLNTIMLGLLIICLVVLIFSSMTAKEKNALVLKNVAMAHNTTDRIMVMKNNPSFKAYAVQLEKIYEAARYSDYSSATKTDSQIERRLDELESVLCQEGVENQSVKNLTDTILMLFKQRAAEAKSLKQGGF